MSVDHHSRHIDDATTPPGGGTAVFVEYDRSAGPL
jgi:hypothetical protein